MMDQESYDATQKLRDEERAVQSALQHLRAQQLQGQFVSGKERNLLKDRSRALARSTRIGEQIVNTVAKVGRNEPCPCGSGLKTKRCCYG